VKEPKKIVVRPWVRGEVYFAGMDPESPSSREPTEK
jgi:hypothetical protein